MSSLNFVMILGFCCTRRQSRKQKCSVFQGYPKRETFKSMVVIHLATSESCFIMC